MKRFRSYESVLNGTLNSFEIKRLFADGAPLGPNSRGYTIARPVHVSSKTYIGKEVIVDPTDIDEGLTAEMLSTTDTLEYVPKDDELKYLRDRVKRHGVHRAALEAQVDYKSLLRLIAGKSTARQKTLDRLRKLFEDETSG